MSTISETEPLVRRARAAIVGLLLAAGSDPNARSGGSPGETPLHWAASRDDWDVAQVLIAGGADPNASDGSIGTPLENAVGYGCWKRHGDWSPAGARLDRLWTVAALGLCERLAEMLVADPAPTAVDLRQAFWHACCGGPPPDYAEGTALEAVRALETRRQTLVARLRAWGAAGG